MLGCNRRMAMCARGLGGIYGFCMSITDQALAIEAAEVGAAVVRSHYGSSLTRFQKSAGDFATTADVEAERAILDALRAARPRDLVLGEESGRTGTGGNERMWLVDPLCGTMNYAVRNMLASVNVALRTGAQVAAAASADPFTEEVFWTDGVAAYVRRRGVDERLAPSAESRLVDVNLDPPFPIRTFSWLPGCSLTKASSSSSVHAWCPPPSPWLGSLLAAAPPTSPMATCATAFTSRPESPSARQPVVLSPASRASRSTPVRAVLSWPPTSRRTSPC
jgi:fructose-1,6-bisphosphatase/inositol monophosphatase family enzyme